MRRHIIIICIFLLCSCSSTSNNINNTSKIESDVLNNLLEQTVINTNVDQNGCPDNKLDQIQEEGKTKSDTEECKIKHNKSNKTDTITMNHISNVNKTNRELYKNICNEDIYYSPDKKNYITTKLIISDSIIVKELYLNENIEPLDTNTIKLNSMEKLSDMLHKEIEQPVIWIDNTRVIIFGRYIFDIYNNINEYIDISSVLDKGKNQYVISYSVSRTKKAIAYNIIGEDNIQLIYVYDICSKEWKTILNELCDNDKIIIKDFKMFWNEANELYFNHYGNGTYKIYKYHSINNKKIMYKNESKLIDSSPNHTYHIISNKYGKGIFNTYDNSIVYYLDSKIFTWIDENIIAIYNDDGITIFSLLEHTILDKILIENIVEGNKVEYLDFKKDNLVIYTSKSNKEFGDIYKIDINEINIAYAPVNLTNEIEDNSDMSNLSLLDEDVYPEFKYYSPDGKNYIRVSFDFLRGMEGRKRYYLNDSNKLIDEVEWCNILDRNNPVYWISNDEVLLTGRYIYNIVELQKKPLSIERFCPFLEEENRHLDYYYLKYALNRTKTKIAYSFCLDDMHKIFVYDIITSEYTKVDEIGIGFQRPSGEVFWDMYDNIYVNTFGDNGFQINRYTFKTKEKSIFEKYSSMEFMSPESKYFMILDEKHYKIVDLVNNKLIFSIEDSDRFISMNWINNKNSVIFYNNTFDDTSIKMYLLDENKIIDMGNFPFTNIILDHYKQKFSVFISDSLIDEQNTQLKGNLYIIDKEGNDIDYSELQEMFYGKWIIERAIPVNVPSIYSREDIDKLIGREIIYSTEMASFDGRACKNPSYKKEYVNENDFLDRNRILYNNIGINENESTIVNVYKDENTEWEEIFASTFIIKDENTLIVTINNTYLELKRID
ncbi:MAG: hypothetical protein N4A50_04240 [Vallitalea sp.]|jgi:hypothetical protein|nr:hypothetical protein [Vallitalea sp.]